jgi:hypothetical protein
MRLTNVEKEAGVDQGLDSRQGAKHAKFGGKK